MPRAGDSPHRTLAVAFGTNQLIEHDDGGLTVPSVHLLDSGTWTDSAVRTALFYPTSVLQRDAANWKDNALWSRHMGGAPRDITDKIGTILNPRAGEKGTIGDLYLHGRTERSKSVIAMIRAGDANYVSVEHGGTEEWNAASKRLEATSMEYYGAAVVNRGACATCTIRGNEANDMTDKQTEPTDEVKQLSAVIDSLTAEVKALAGEVAAIKTARELEEKEDKPTPATETAVKELADTLGARIEKLEKAPAPAATSPGAPERELGEVETFARIDRENKTIMGV